jgi:beta-lactamase regulating signal transducer with metallopeptidase domain
VNNLPWLESVNGWLLVWCQALIQFLVQGTIIGLGAIVFDRVFRRASPDTRHAFFVLTLVLIVLAPIVTCLQCGYLGPKIVIANASSNPESSSVSEIVVAPTEEMRPSDSALDEPQLSEQTRSSDLSSTVVTAPTDSRFEIPVWYLYVLAFVYAMGVTYKICCLVHSWVSSRRWNDESRPIEDASLLARVREQARRLGLRWTPRVRLHAQVSVPSVVGLLRPCIFVPATMLTGMPIDYVMSLLSHEMIHIRRGDMWIRLVQTLCESLLFFHPMVWWLSHRIDEEREQICDDRVVRGGVSQVAYADALVCMAELCLKNRRQRRHIQSLAVDGGNSSALTRRVRRLLSGEVPRQVHLPGWSIVGGLIIVMGLATFSFPQLSWSSSQSAEPVGPMETTSTATAEVSGSISVRVKNPSGDYLKKFNLRLWKLIVDQDEKADWVEADSKRRWKNVAGSSTGDGKTERNLAWGTYMITVQEDHHQVGRMGRSSLIAITQDNLNHQIEIETVEGATLRVKPVDEETRDGIENVSIALETLQSDLPSNSTFRPTREEKEFVFSHLVPGTYRVTARHWSPKPEYLKYESVEEKQDIVVKGRESLSILFAMKGRPQTELEIATHWPWSVHGQVLDIDGNPMEGVEIWASAGWGSLRSSQIATTDKNGRYAGRFSQTGLRSSEPGKVEVVSGQVSAHKLGYFEKNLSRQGGSFAVNRLPKQGETTIQRFDEKVAYIQGQPREVNFVMLPTAQVKVRLLDQQGQPLNDTNITLDGEELPHASSIYSSEKTDKNGIALFDVPTGYLWHFESRYGDRQSARSASTTFRSGSYEIQLKYQLEEQTGIMRLNVAPMNSSLGEQDVARVLVDEPSFQPPAGNEIQQQAQEVLRRTRESNRHWIDGPDWTALKSIRYSYKLQGKEPQEIEVDAKSPRLSPKTRGVSMVSGVDQLLSRPEQAVIRSIKERDGKTDVVFAFKLSVGLSYGNGIDGTWRGYRSTAIREGKLTIDSKRLVPLELRSGNHREEYLDYVEIEPGRFAPTRIRINDGQFDWRFRIHKTSVWLFDQTLSDESEEPIACVREVEVSE